MVVHEVIIIGAGPAGISTAVEAIERGVKSEDILILEKSGEVIHMIASKYPDEKAVLANYKNKVAESIGGLQIEDMTKQEFTEFIHGLIERNNLQIRFHQNVEQITKLHNGQLAIQTSEGSYLANSIFMAIGTMSSPRTLGAKIADSICDRIFYDLQGVTEEMKKVLVVGGGDSAGEYAKILVERGHEVTLSYRKGSFSRMIDTNREKTQKLINEKKLGFLPSTNIAQVEAQQGSPLVFFKEDQSPLAIDAIVAALGTEKPSNYLSTLGIKMGREGQDIFSESSLEGVFFVGDLASGKKGGTINIAFNSGRQAVEEACSYYLDCVESKD
jgi:thioredoxin reductase